MRDKHLIILSSLGLILVLLSPAKDMICYLTLVLGWILIIISRWLIISMKDRKFDYLTMVGIVLTILGMFVSQLQPVPWLNFLPFSYYLILAFIITISVERTLGVINKKLEI